METKAADQIRDAANEHDHQSTPQQKSRQFDGKNYFQDDDNKEKQIGQTIQQSSKAARPIHLTGDPAIENICYSGKKIKRKEIFIGDHYY